MKKTILLRLGAVFSFLVFVGTLLGGSLVMADHTTNADGTPQNPKYTLREPTRTHDPFEIDAKRAASGTITNGGGSLEITTKEKYRVTLHVPSGSITTQPVTLAPLKSKPFSYKKSSFKGTGVFVKMKYGNLSGRYFSKPAWLVFDFSPEEWKADRNKPVDYCRPDFFYFRPFRCLNEQSASFDHDNLFVFAVDSERSRELRLAPVYKLKKDVYAVEVLEEGIFIPRKVKKSEITTLTELVASSWYRGGVSHYVEAARGLEYFKVQPGEKMKEKFKDLTSELYLNTLDYVTGLYYYGKYGFTVDADKLKRKLEITRQGMEDWPDYYATLAVARRTYPSANFLPDILGADVGALMREKFESRFTKVLDKIRIVVAFNEVLKFRKQQTKVAWWRNLIAGTAYAQGSDWFDDFQNDVRNNLNDLINQTTDFGSLLILAQIAFEWEQDDIGNSALEKAASELDKQIDAASGAGGGGASGSSDDSCDLIHKNLSNFAKNDCAGVANLLDLASKAALIEEDDLMNKALKKAGLLE